MLRLLARVPQVYKRVTGKLPQELAFLGFGTPPNTWNYATSEPNLQMVRYKSKKFAKKSNVESTETESEDLEENLDKNTKILSISVNSLRVDGVLKAGLGIARNKIETLFYESKIRVNGAKLQKKSQDVRIGDEIDIVKSVSPSNPDFLIVARLEIISFAGREDQISIKIKRNKSLTIEDYGRAPR